MKEQIAEINVPRLQIVSHAGTNSPDVAIAQVSLQYYESLLEFSVKAAISYMDTGQRNVPSGKSTTELDDANPQFAEEVYLEITDDLGNKISFTNKNNSLVSLSPFKVLSDNQKELIVMYLGSKEYLLNTLLDRRVRTTYEGKVSDIVKNILQTHLKTQKPLDIEPTLNKLKFGGRIDEQGIPFEALLFLCPRAVPQINNALGKTAGYFFFETSEGYKFKSIDTLFSQKPKKRFISNDTPTLPNGYDANIRSFSCTGGANYLKHLQMGTYNSTMIAYDPYKQTFKNSSIDSKQQEKAVILAADAYPNIPEFLNKPSTFVSSSIDIGYNPPGFTDKEQATKSTEINFDVEKIYNQSRMRFNQIFAVKTEITIFCDLSLHVGDMIECYFPEVADTQTQITSVKKSGKYLITDLCHNITPNGPNYTKLGIARDSFGER